MSTTGPPPAGRPAPARGSAGWRVVLPVKGTTGAKSRLAAVTAQAPGLPLALARDALDAVLACPLVAGAWVVTAEASVLAAWEAPGVHLVAESSPGAGLLAAVADGVAAAEPPAPAGLDDGDAAEPGGVAVLLADVPCLRPSDLADALAAVDAALRDGAPQACVLDAEGTGTVLLAARRGAALSPRFGPGSASAHRAAGAVDVGGAARLRRDVDTPGELAAALVLGVGPATRAALGGVSRAS